MIATILPKIRLKMNNEHHRICFMTNTKHILEETSNSSMPKKPQNWEELQMEKGQQ